MIITLERKQAGIQAEVIELKISIFNLKGNLKDKTSEKI